MSCVNRSCKEFKELMRATKLSSEALNYYVHLWQNTIGKEGEFPDAGWVKGQARGSATIVAGPAQMELWEKKYKNPLLFNTRKEATAAYKEAAKIFDKKSLYITFMNDGRFRLSVIRPIDVTKSQVEKEDSSPSRGLMYEKSQDRNYNLNRVKEHYSVALSSKANLETYNHYVNEILSHVKEVEFKNDNESDKDALARINEIINDVKNSKNGFIIDKMYPVKLKDTNAYKIYIKFKSFEDIVNAKLKLLENLSDDALASEALRLEQESMLNDEYYINPKKVEELKQQVRKNSFRYNYEIDEAFEFLQSLENNPDLNQYVEQCIKWLKNDTIELPRDNENILDAFKEARRLHIDTQKFKSPIDLLIYKANLEKVDEGDTINMSERPIFSLNRTVNTEEGTIEIYDVPNNEEGQQAVMQVLADATPKDSSGKPVMNSPWCLAVYNYDVKTKKATPTNSALNTYWPHYNMGKRQIAILNGKPIAFNSTNKIDGRDEWWDFKDKSHDKVEDCKLQVFKDQSNANPAETTVTLGNTTYTYTRNGIENLSKTMFPKINGFSTIIREDTNFYDKKYIDKIIKINPVDNQDENTKLSVYTPISRDGISIELGERMETGNFVISIPYNTVYFDKDSKSYYWRETSPIISIMLNGRLERFDYEINEDGSITISKDSKTLKSFNVNSLKVLEKLLYSNELYSNKQAVVVVNQLIPIREIIKDLAKEVYEIYGNTESNTNVEHNELPPRNSNTNNGVTSNNTNLTNAVTDAVETAQLNNALNNAVENLNLPYNLNSEATNEDDVVNNETSEYPTNVENSIENNNTEVLEMTQEELSALGQEVNDFNSTDEQIEPKTIMNTLQALKEDRLTRLYNEQVKKPFNAELDRIFRNILEEYHFDIRTTNLKEMYDQDALGALDILQKVIYLSDEGDIEKVKAIAEPEEFAHAFIELMGSAYYSPKARAKYDIATREYSELRDLIETTSFYKEILEQYKNVYTYQNGNPDLVKIKKEAVGKALGATIVGKFEEKTEADKTFTKKLKKWFNDALLFFKAVFGNKSAQLQRKLDAIAESILNGSYAEKYLDKVHDTNYKLVTFKDTLAKQNARDGGKALNIIQKLNRHKSILTGSLSYRAQGTVYRSEEDNLHDLDFVVKAEDSTLYMDHPSLAHITQRKMGKWTSEMLLKAVADSPYIRSIKEDIPDFYVMYAYPENSGKCIISNNAICDDPRIIAKFKSLKGNFNQRLAQLEPEEREKLYLVDIFFNKGNVIDTYSDTESDITMTDFTESFSAKLKMGRAKDLYDYQRFLPYNRKYNVKKSSKGALFYKNENSVPGERISLNDSEGIARIKDKVKFNNIEIAGMKIPFDSKLGKFLQSESQSNGILQYFITDNNEFIENLKDSSYSHSYFISNSRIPKEILKEELEEFSIYNGENNTYKTDEVIGLLIEAIDEDFGKVKTLFNNLKEACTNQEVLSDSHVINTISKTGELTLSNLITALHLLLDSTFSISNTTVTYEPLSQKEINFNNSEEGDTEKPAPVEEKESGREDKHKSISDIHAEFSARIDRQMDALLDSDLISPIELRHLAEQIVNCVSDYITQAMTDPQSVSDFFNGEFDGIDFSKMSRKEIVNTIGIDKLLEACKKKFDPNSREEDDEFYDDEDTLAIAKEVMKNWDALLYMASDVFRSNEDFSIVTDDGLTHTTEDSTVLNADELEVSDDEDDVNEHEGSQQMHWQIKMTTLDTLRTMSQEVKDALRQLYILDEHGNPVYDRFGIRERINVRKATQSILRWGQGSVTLSNLVTALKEKEQSNPWLKPLIKKLSDKNGEYATFQSQFWGTFDKHFITMSIVRKQDGMYISQAVNEHPALSEVAKQIEIAYNIGEHPLFEPSGVNTESLKQLSNDYDTLRNLRNSDFNKPENVQKIYEALVNATNLLGYNIPIEMVENALKLNNQNLEDFKSMYEALGYIVKSIEAGSKKEDYNPFKFKDRNSINGNLRAFLRPLTDTLEDTMINAVYDDGEMHQSYITPSWLSNMFVKFTRDEESFKKYIESEFGTSEWYKKDGAWRQPWIEAMVQNPAFRKIFKHKIQLNFDGSNYMKTMDDLQYTLSVFAEYFTKGDSKESMTTAWYRVPMQSNKPTSEFIQFMSYRGPFYKNSITTGMIKIFSQELDRIVTVMLRNKDKTDPDFIKNFDTKGKKFVLLDFMNSYLEGRKKANTEFGKALQAEINDRIQKVRDPEHSSTTKNTELEASLQTIIKEEMEAKVKSILESWKNKGVIEAAKKIENIGKSDAEVTANLENFIWNDTFAAMNILELTVVDPAYYADAEDLQKRLAQIHAPGIRGNAEATDFKGNSVTDGKVRTFYLNDFDDVTSNVIDNLTEVFDRKIREAKGVEKEGYKALKEALVGAKGVYRQINVTDAQAYNCPTSYRKKAFIFGKWSKRAEDVYNRILRNEHPSYTEIQEAFQPLKPFAYSQVAKESGVVGAPIQNLKMGIQNKNAEYLLIMADAILKGEQTSRPNLLRAIYEVMEDSHKNADGTVKIDGIDTVQFNSAVKTGPRNGISVKDLINNPNGEAILKSRINQSIYKWDTKQVTNENNENSENTENTNVHTKTSEYNSDYIHELDLDGYCLQQEVPAHFMEHEQSHGSQIRAILPSDLAITDVNGNAVTYHTDKGDVTAKEFIEDYENTIAENINASIDNLKKEFNLPIDNNGLVDQRDVNKAISRVLQHEILTSPRYGMDLYQACSVDEAGNFKIPLGDPIQSKRIEQLINSIIKKRVNKQEIAGGPVVQVSSFGTSSSLHIKFKNKNGGKLLSREEWKEAKEKEKLEAPTTATNTQTTNNKSLVVTGNSSTTAAKAKEIGGIDTLRHPDYRGMHFGNPFSHANYAGTIKVGSVKEAVQAFEQWLRGEKYQEVEPKRRQWIVDQINNGSLVGKPLVYYTDKVPDNSYGRTTYDPIEAPNHAHILQKLINEAASGKSMRQTSKEYSIKTSWARTADPSKSYEVSSAGDKRFSALYAKFKNGTTIDGNVVSNMSIEDVYQKLVKKSKKGMPPSEDSIINLNRKNSNGEPAWLNTAKELLPKELWHKLYGIYSGNYEAMGIQNPEITKEDIEDFSYYMGYLPLWQEWARQNPELMQELREKSADKVLTDKFANTRVSQARALSDILNGTTSKETLNTKNNPELAKVEREVGTDAVVTTIKTLNSDNSELSVEEKKSITEVLGDKRPKVLVASEVTDPVFHAKKIKEMVERELAKDPKDRSFHMMYLITKHDGLPLKELAGLKIPKFIHFSITSLGGTKYEPGVMKTDDLLDRIEKLIQDKAINPNLVTIRIDPFIPGVTKESDVRHIVERATKMGIRQFKFSVMDSYGYTESGEKSTNSRDRFIVQKMTELGYNWDEHYGRDNSGKVNFNAKPKTIESIYRFMDELAEEFNVFFNTCGEQPKFIQGLKRIRTNVGCINVASMNAAMGTKDIADVKGNQRNECSCYGFKSDALRYSDNCASSCVYCYAKHNSDKALEYYNEDGTLKDNPLTRTSEVPEKTFGNSTTTETPTTSDTTIDNNEEGTTNGLGNTYEEYLKNNQGGIDYFEVYAPIYSKELLEKFADEKGNIDIKSIEALDPDLLKMVGYRIPTEAKYSAAPLKIVGFLPREAGDAIMMPEEITAINGSDFDVDKMYLMRKVLNIKKNDISRSKLHRLLYDELVNSQKSKLSYNTKLSINDLINQFLDNPYAKSSLVNQETAQGYMSMPEAAYEKLLKTYLQNKYTVEKPTKGKLYRDNKIVDMTYEVLTHATSADQVLNPQDFSTQKRAGYMIEAYRQGYDWEYLKSKSISELKDLISTEKNLSYIDTHIQFYKQNSSAASLLGIFAVNRVAHAVIETSHPYNDNRSTYAVDIADEDSFSLLGHIFSGRMDFDMRKSWDGELIGKTLGSLVGASADAVKDPILNLMNVNKETVNVLNTLARFGMPFDQVALFISQSSLAKVVDKYNSNKLKGIGGSISDIINARIKEITRDFGIDKNSRIQYEDLTEEELIKGLRVNNTTEDAKIEFKVLNTFKKLQNIASSTRLLNTATRVNSISSAVGPLIVDNLIYENQVNDLNRRSAIYERTVLPDGREIYRKSTVQSVIEANPILKGFSQGYSLARQLLRKMPAYSVGFSNIIDIAETECKPLITDRKSMSDLVDFYNSYLLIQSGVIDETKLEYYISEFPKEFIRNYKNNEKYKDNPLIQAIRLSEDNGKRAALAVNTMGADSDFIQNLSMGWLSLYKSDKELAMKLFEYNFFRGGIGFSPKTFMRLLPVRMKTDIEGYLETYRTLPMVDPHLVLNQFVRNNWRNNRIVPVKNITINTTQTNTDENVPIIISKTSDVESLRGVHYFKKGTYNQLTGKTDYKVYENITYSDNKSKVMYITELDTLGANNDYIEMSTEPIYDHAVITTKTDVKTSEEEQQNLKETQQQLDKQMDPENDSILGDGELSEKDIADASAYYDSLNEDSNEHRYTDEELEDLLVRSFLTLPGIETREQAIARINDQKEGISNTRDPEKLASNQVKYENFFKNKLMQLGITPNEDLLKELYKKLC